MNETFLRGVRVRYDSRKNWQRLSLKTRQPRKALSR